MKHVHIGHQSDPGAREVVRQIDVIATTNTIEAISYDEVRLGSRRLPPTSLAGVAYSAVYMTGDDPWQDWHVEIIDRSYHALAQRHLASLALRELTMIEPEEVPADSLASSPFRTEQICSLYGVPVCVVNVSHEVVPSEAAPDNIRTATLYHPTMIDPVTSLLALQSALAESS